MTANSISPNNIAKKITECYNSLPDNEAYTGAPESNFSDIMKYQLAKLHLAADCVFAGYGINRQTGARM